ncbi:hypothetical protein AVEN_260899-1 [Araneus ventricosus]|uniref:ATP-dependent DNA helicase n=1 Tax=Araneus ventricosus TaxID=182803 RepID=A0A4Y2HDT6_ARAVE|nr:hypothetical protein AVEN_260899-1 [Araneus ventricosus]
MNLRQRELFNTIASSIQEQMNRSLSRIRTFVTGGAGVGKTFTFNALKEQVNRCYGKKAVGVCTLTGVAARFVGETMLHTLFKLPVEKDGKILGNLAPLIGNYLKILRNQWKDAKFLFINEISMVPYEMLCMIDSRLRQLKKKEIEPFGGINIMVFGDLFQLPRSSGIPPACKIYSGNSFVETPQSCGVDGEHATTKLYNICRILYASVS